MLAFSIYIFTITLKNTSDGWQWEIVEKRNCLQISALEFKGYRWQVPEMFANISWPFSSIGYLTAACCFRGHLYGFRRMENHSQFGKNIKKCNDIMCEGAQRMLWHNYRHCLLSFLDRSGFILTPLHPFRQANSHLETLSVFWISNTPHLSHQQILPHQNRTTHKH